MLMKRNALPTVRGQTEARVCKYRRYKRGWVDVLVSLYDVSNQPVA